MFLLLLLSGFLKKNEFTFFYTGSQFNLNNLQTLQHENVRGEELLSSTMPSISSSIANRLSQLLQNLENRLSQLLKNSFNNNNNNNGGAAASTVRGSSFTAQSINNINTAYSSMFNANRIPRRTRPELPVFNPMMNQNRQIQPQPQNNNYKDQYLIRAEEIVKALAHILDLLADIEKTYQHRPIPTERISNVQHLVQEYIREFDQIVKKIPTLIGHRIKKEIITID